MATDAQILREWQVDSEFFNLLGLKGGFEESPNSEITYLNAALFTDWRLKMKFSNSRTDRVTHGCEIRIRLLNSVCPFPDWSSHQLELLSLNPLNPLSYGQLVSHLQVKGS